MILGKCPTQRLKDSTFTAEKIYAINFSEKQNKFCLSFYYNGINSYLFINGVKIYKFKAKDFEINAGSLRLGNLSKTSLADDMKKVLLCRYVYFLSLYVR